MEFYYLLKIRELLCHAKVVDKSVSSRAKNIREFEVSNAEKKMSEQTQLKLDKVPRIRLLNKMPRWVA
jgi:hypothetical protein